MQLSSNKVTGLAAQKKVKTCAIFAPMYRILRTVLFAFDAERVHYFSMDLLRSACRFSMTKSLLRRMFRPDGKGLTTIFLGLSFPNPVGLAAGFDKNARYLGELETLGFGYVEIGTVTPVGQAGNEKPRLFRLPKDRALINRMGFNNDGVMAVAERLANWRRSSEGKMGQMIIGGNIGKNKHTPNEDAWKDYVNCFQSLHGLVDYFVVNVSSPNTPGLRELQEKGSLRKILTSLQRENESFALRRPILLKIAPDLSTEQIDDVIDLALEIKLDGIVAANTTTNRQHLQTGEARLEKIGMGGLSGLPVKDRSTAIIRHIHQRTAGAIPLMASGGIFTGADAIEKLQAGASLVQVWTGFIYEGPAIVKNICKAIRSPK
jgi:dihydroorotate dehydrogenase